jgi:DNA-binding phage protein
MIPLTRSFNETLRARAAADPGFVQALLAEAGQALLQGELEDTRAALRATINATIGFEALARPTGIPPKSLMRMFGPNGNPTAANLSGVLAALQAKLGVQLEVRAVEAAE